MGFCENCGKPLALGVKFCSYCGSKVKPVNFSGSYDCKKENEAGVQICPNCGDSISFFMTTCPSCGAEIHSRKTSSAVQEITYMMQQIDARSMPDVPQSWMKKIFGKDLQGDIDAADDAEKKWKEQKINEKCNLILNFSVPNTKQDLFEFISMAASNIHANRGLNIISNGVFDKVTKAWIKKLDQVYQQAAVVFNQDSDFRKIQDIYFRKKEDIKKAKSGFHSFITGCALAVSITVVLLFGMIFVGIFVSDKTDENYEDGIRVSYSANSLKRKDYRDVIKIFRADGFTNITTREIDDLITGWLTKEGEVESVSIDGNDSFEEDSWYSDNAEVVISYHTFPEEEQASETEPASELVTESAKNNILDLLDSVEGKNIVEVKKILKDSGYKITFLHDYTEVDLTSEISSYKKKEKQKFIVTRIGEIDDEKQKITLYVDSKDNIKKKEKQEKLEEQLTEKLDPYYAWYAAEEYGETQYPYGFELHYIVGILAQEPVDKDTWFLKAACTVENAYGNKSDMTCEVKVSGTTDNPHIEDFKVY